MGGEGVGREWVGGEGVGGEGVTSVGGEGGWGGGERGDRCSGVSTSEAIPMGIFLLKYPNASHT